MKIFLKDMMMVPGAELGISFYAISKSVNFYSVNSQNEGLTEIFQRRNYTNKRNLQLITALPPPYELSFSHFVLSSFSFFFLSLSLTLFFSYSPHSLLSCFLIFSFPQPLALSFPHSSFLLSFSSLPSPLSLHQDND